MDTTKGPLTMCQINPNEPRRMLTLAVTIHGYKPEWEEEWLKQARWAMHGADGNELTCEDAARLLFDETYSNVTMEIQGYIWTMDEAGLRETIAALPGDDVLDLVIDGCAWQLLPEESKKASIEEMRGILVQHLLKATTEPDEFCSHGDENCKCWDLVGRILDALVDIDPDIKELTQLWMPEPTEL